jgi:hypothetical protein
MEPLKLIALDAEDLEVMSAHLQDAVLRIGDMAFVPKQKRFALIVNRFDWEGANASDGEKKERRRATLRFERVMDAKIQNLKQRAASAAVELLAVQFEETTSPEGYITLVFAGGGAVRLQVECIEAELSDLGPAWRAESRPEHDIESDATGS